MNKSNYIKPFLVHIPLQHNRVSQRHYLLQLSGSRTVVTLSSIQVHTRMLRIGCHRCSVDNVEQYGFRVTGGVDHTIARKYRAKVEGQTYQSEYGEETL